MYLGVEDGIASLFGNYLTLFNKLKMLFRNVHNYII